MPSTSSPCTLPAVVETTGADAAGFALASGEAIRATKTVADRTALAAVARLIVVVVVVVVVVSSVSLLCPGRRGRLLEVTHPLSFVRS